MRAAALGLLLCLGWGTQPELRTVALPAEGKPCPMPGGGYFLYGFASKPKMGTVVLRLRLFDKGGKRSTAFQVLGRTGMPAMKGAHDSGDIPFKLNKKGDYLLPVEVAMPGEWEVVLTFRKSGKELYRGSLRFSV